MVDRVGDGGGLWLTVKVFAVEWWGLSRNLS